MIACPRSVLVLGGTGLVGRALLRLLAGDPAFSGTRLIVPSRKPRQAQALAMQPGVVLMHADVHEPSVLATLVHGVDAVINLVAILHGNEASFEHTHVELPRKLVQACQSAGVRRLIHVSALGVDEASAELAPSMYLRSKARGEQVLRAAARSGQIELSILRPSVIFGAEDRFVNLFASLQKLAPILPLAGAQARFQPVWVGDVAAALARCLSDPRTIHQTIECAGPEVLSLGDIVRRAGRWAGCERPIWPLPEALALLQARLMTLLPGPTLMSPDNVLSMRLANVATGQQPGLASLDIQATSMDAVMAPHLAERGGHRFSAHDLRRRLAGRD
ncbi:complex I NDUFA9 subunit family protein [Leptothrix ochracea]|uniref:complex I NDUFA9 subunit family protein n=2 Tax=Leptothrix ochracea TaxID=735331 RepID=UPI0034E1C3CB